MEALSDCASKALEVQDLAADTGKLRRKRRRMKIPL